MKQSACPFAVVVVDGNSLDGSIGRKVIRVSFGRGGSSSTSICMMQVEALQWLSCIFTGRLRTIIMMIMMIIMIIIIIQINIIIANNDNNDDNIYIYIYIYMYISIMTLILRLTLTVTSICTIAAAASESRRYARSPLEDSRLFGPSPWIILAATNEKTHLSNPAPGENLLSGNLVMETGGTCTGTEVGRRLCRRGRTRYCHIYIYIYIHIYVHIYTYNIMV